MDKDKEIIDTYEFLLQNRCSNKVVTLYKNNPSSLNNMHNPYDPGDVLANISKQIKAYQTADVIKKPAKHTINIKKKSEFIPLNVMINTESLNQQTRPTQENNDFDTQCVSDTQLIHIIENAEALIDVGQDMEHVFVNTFCNKEEICDKNSTETMDQVCKDDEISYSYVNKREKVNGNKLKDSQETIVFNDILSNDVGNIDEESKKDNENHNCNKENSSPSILDLKNNNTQNIRDIILKNTCNENIDAVLPLSPILNKAKPTIKLNIPSPLVYKLESFEKFESIALSLMQENPDYEVAKKLINSQIINKELFIHTHKEPILGDRDKTYEDKSRTPSPILGIENKNYINIYPEVVKQNDIKSNCIIKEDELLFESDEDDIIEKNLEDLPLTCALTTSFYNQPDVLDKTMYVGFQTASNKSIQVCTDSFSKACSMYNKELKNGKEVLTFKELVEVFDKSSKFNENSDIRDNMNNNMDISETNKEKVDLKKDDQSVLNIFEKDNMSDILLKDEFLNDKYEYSDTQNSNNIGTKNLNDHECFKNEFKEIEKGNSNIDVLKGKICTHLSEDDTSEYFKIDDNIMNEFENNIMFDKTDIEKLSANKAYNKEDLDNKFNSEALERGAGLKNAFVSFKTANDKEIKISKEALAKTKTIFDDIDVSNLDTISKTNNEEDCSSNFKNLDCLFHETLSSQKFIAFKTAKNKMIQVTDQALAKTRNIFEGIDTDTYLPKNHSKLEQNGTNTTPNITNIANIAKSAKRNSDYVCPLITKAKISKQINIETNNDPNCQNNINNKNPISIGFKTASNKPVKISEAALIKSKKIFQDINDNIDKPDQFEDESHRNAKNNSLEKDIASNIFQGFKTASNKNVVISKDALIKSKKIFQDIDLSNPNLTDHTEKSPQNPYKCEKLDILFKGFRTASNKDVEVSKEAIAKSEKIFQDADLNNLNENNNFMELFDRNKPSTSSCTLEKICDFQGFKTASNKKVKISKEALAKTKDIFKDIDSSENQLNPVSKISNDEMIGLKPTKDNNLQTFKDGLTKSANLLENIGTNGKVSSFQGFQTASNKQVRISEEALFKSRKLFENIDLDIGNSQANKYIEFGINIANPKDKENVAETFKGFQTASNKNVNITKEALMKNRKIFEDMDINMDNPQIENTTDNVCAFKGFQTASNKNVQISKDALMKSRRIFEDMEISDPQFSKNNEDDLNPAKCNKPIESGFKGFQTASNKNVQVSKDALLKSKKIFEDISLNLATKYILNDKGNNKNKHIKEPPFCFNIANNKRVKLSEEALEESRNLFANTNEKSHKYVSYDQDKAKNEDDLNLEELMNTEVIKFFEETMCTEDFLNDKTPTNKRSGSPILSCPKAKKRTKFETPLNAKNVLSNSINIVTIPISNSYKFEENYKQNKNYTLKDVEKIEKSVTYSQKVESYILNFDFDTLLNFEFSGARNELDNNVWSIYKIKTYFQESVNRKIVPKGWIENHLKLILWKLLSYEIRFPRTMKNVCSVKNVLEQLKYRYDKELYNVKRPALRKILEKDDVAAKRMILCVASFYVDGVSVSSVANSTTNIELLLTDGWYCVKANTDRMIDRLICEGKIKIGTKLAIHGAELVNCDQGIAPWEDISSVRLKISGNSTRRARWDARLGFHGNGAILCPLTAVKLDGGKVSRIRVFVTRAYPTLYVEKFEDGSTVTRSERLEHLHQMKYENDRQIQMEKLYEEVEKFSDQESQDSEGLEADGRNNLETGSQISRLMKRSKDPADFRAHLTDTQIHLLQEHTTKHREKLLQGIQRKVQDLMKKRGLDVARSVVPLLKIRVAGVDNVICKAMITIWRPNESLLDLIKEGAWIDIYNVVPTSVRYSELQISAGRQSVFKHSTFKEIDKLKTITQSLQRKCYTIKDLRNTSMITDYNEIDTIGIVFLIEPSYKEFESLKQPFQNVYLADTEKNIICVNFWAGIKKFGFENILDAGQIVACVNLQKRAGNTKKNIPHYRATEFSYFTKTPKFDAARKMVDDLAAKFKTLDRRKFIDDCIAIQRNQTIHKYGNTENISPYRFNNSDYNITRNKMFIDSPLANKCTDVNLNLTGLDFESSFKQADTQELSPKSLLRKKKVNERIAKLKMYGEPPPLSHVYMINKSNKAIKPYKSPLIAKNEPPNVTSIKNLPENKEISNDVDSSPLLGLNKTYVKRTSINPVKLNFSNENNDSAVDPFGEDFDESPPLSLD